MWNLSSEEMDQLQGVVVVLSVDRLGNRQGPREVGARRRDHVELVGEEADKGLLRTLVSRQAEERDRHGIPIHASSSTFVTTAPSGRTTGAVRLQAKGPLMQLRPMLPKSLTWSLSSEESTMKAIA